MFNRAAGAMRLTEIAYRGVAPVINDLLAEQHQDRLGDARRGVPAPAAPARMLPVAVADERARSPDPARGTPTFVESGFDIDVSELVGLLYGPADAAGKPLVARP